MPKSRHLLVQISNINFRPKRNIFVQILDTKQLGCFGYLKNYVKNGLAFVPKWDKFTSENWTFLFRFQTLSGNQTDWQPNDYGSSKIWMRSDLGARLYCVITCPVFQLEVGVKPSVFSFVERLQDQSLPKSHNDPLCSNSLNPSLLARIFCNLKMKHFSSTYYILIYVKYLSEIRMSEVSQGKSKWIIRCTRL